MSVPMRGRWGENLQADLEVPRVLYQQSHVLMDFLNFVLVKSSANSGEATHVPRSEKPEACGHFHQFGWFVGIGGGWHGLLGGIGRKGRFLHGVGGEGIFYPVVKWSVGLVEVREDGFTNMG